MKKSHLTEIEEVIEGQTRKLSRHEGNYPNSL
jgi:hypothetical protein